MGHSHPDVEGARVRVAAEGFRAKIGVVLGSGLGAFASLVEGARSIPYSAVPDMPGAGVAGHRGRLLCGSVFGRSVLCLEGRAHGYEGHAPNKVVFGVRLLSALGCETVILTNAAGGISGAFSPGDLMLITDHLNLTGHSPLAGPLLPPLERFVDMTEAYDRQVRAAAVRAAAALSIELKQGVYAGLPGPNYETPAEIRMLAILGAHAVGMSTVLETLALRQLGVRVGGMSLISNLAAGLSQSSLSHHEVQVQASQSQERTSKFLAGWIKELPDDY